MPQIRLQLSSGKIHKCAALTDFPAALAPSVDLIDARRCGLREFDARPFRNLEVALLNSNSLEAFPDFGKCRRLRFLQIYSNSFTLIRPKCVPQSLREVIIDDLGPQLYPVSRGASIRLYDGYGRVSDVLSQERVRQIRAEYIAWCDRYEAESACCEDTNRKNRVGQAANGAAQCILNAADGRASNEAVGLQNDIVELHNSAIELYNSVLDGAPQQHNPAEDAPSRNYSFHRENAELRGSAIQSFEDQPAIDLEGSQNDELKGAQQPRRQLKRPTTLVID